MITASGIGSWPGTETRAAIGAVQELLGGIDAAARGIRGLPYLPELPERGPGADMIGRSAALLAGLHIDLQPSGWRLVDHPGKDSVRASAYLRQDRDELAEAYADHAGPLKVSFAGPWTLAANVRLARGERVVGDPGAARDMVQSAAEGYGAELERLKALVPGATWVVQIDEPSLPSVLAGRLPTSSGYGRHRAVDEEVVVRGLGAFVEAVKARLDADGGDRHVERKQPAERLVVHCCASDVPFGLLTAVGADAVCVDVGLLTASGWEKAAELLEKGRGLWTGLPVPLTSVAGEPGRPDAVELVKPVERAWQTMGLGADLARRLTLTPACGLAGAASPAHAAALQGVVVEAAAHLRDVIIGD